MLGSSVPFLFFFPAILVSGWYGGLGPGLLATGLSAFVSFYFYMEPEFSFALVRTGDVIILGLFITVGVFISLLSSRWQQAREAERRQRQYFQVTLAGIGDAVIATDVTGRVTFMNAVAESLTGWSRQEARNRPLADVFSIINEKTRRPVESPVAKVLREGKIVGLANHTHLLARDGREIPIDDSSAPIRSPEGDLIGMVLIFRDISEHKNLELVRTQLAAIVESSDDAIIGKTLDGTITSWNKGAEQLYGYAAEDVLGRPISLLIPPDRPDELPQILMRLQKGERIDHFETKRITRDGRLLDISLTVSPIRDDSGAIVGASAIARDVSERRRWEEGQQLLLKIAEMIRRADGADDLLFAVARALGEHLQVRRAFFNEIDLANDRETVHRDYCRGVDSVAGVHRISDYSDATSAEISAGKTVVNRDSQSDPRTAELYERVYKPNGERAYVAVPLLREGRWVASLWVSDDRPRDWREQEVSLLETAAERAWLAVEKMCNEKALRDSEERLRRAIQIETVGIIFFQTEGRILEANAAFLRLSGYTPEDIEDGLVRWDEMTPPEWMPRSLQAIAEFKASGRTTPYEKELIRRDGARWWALCAATRFGDEEGVEYIIDITASKRVEQEREQLLEREKEARVEAEEAKALSAQLLEMEAAARAQAEKANRVKDEFLATISHELRTPLNAIQGWAVLLRDDRLDEVMTARALETIDRNARAQARIIEDLLDVSRIITGRLRLEVQQVALQPIIRAALDVVQPAADTKGVRLEANLDPQVGPISGDPDRLQQIIWNLLSNAVRFTPQGGRVEACLERVNSSVQIVVRDTGQGISPDFLPHVFDRFRQADSTTTRRYGGLGLGLAIVRHLTELHGGTVEARSEGEGKGATFIVSIPS